MGETDFASTAFARLIVDAERLTLSFAARILRINARVRINIALMKINTAIA